MIYEIAAFAIRDKGRMQ